MPYPAGRPAVWVLDRMAYVACRLSRPADAARGLTEFAAIGGLAEYRVREGQSIAVLAVTLALADECP